MFRPRASARSRAAALTVVLCAIASFSMAMGRPGFFKEPAARPFGRKRRVTLPRAVTTRGEALAEYATGRFGRNPR